MTIRLIVNADDYGITSGVSAGIRKAHRSGIVTTTTAMMNMPGVKDDLRLLKDECPDLGAGVHLVMTQGSPLRPADKVSSLVTETGTFYAPSVLRARVEQLDIVELRDEWRLQIETFLASGLPLDHLDSHHHVSYWHEITFEAMLGLAEEYAVPIRNPYPAMRTPDTDNPRETSTFETFVPRLIARHPVEFPDQVIISFYDEMATFDHLMAILNDMPAGTSELMCHPGQVEDELRPITIYHEPRERELEILTHPRVLELVKRRDIKLVTFKEAI